MRLHKIHGWHGLSLCTEEWTCLACKTPALVLLLTVLTAESMIIYLSLSIIHEGFEFGYSGHVGELSDYASSARYLACCSEYKRSAKQVKFGHGLTTTIGPVNYRVSRNCLVANCCSDEK